MKLDPYPIPLIKMYLEWIKDLKIRSKAVKLLEDDTGLGKDFLDITPKAQATKATRSEWDYAELRSCSARKTINEMKRQPRKRKTFANGFTSKMYKKVKQLSTKTTTNNLIKNRQRICVDIFPKQTYKCLTSI